jgi:Spy/CpxP family protein refolding chaperone
MKENLKALLLLFSAVLNIAFVGTAIYHKWSSPPAGSALPGNRPFLYEELNLTKEQLEKFEPLRNRFHARLHETSSEIRNIRLHLIDLLAASDPDREAIRRQQEQIFALQKRMQRTVINHLLDESTILTAEQRARLFHLIRERSETRGGPWPPWMSTPQAERAGSERTH